MAIQNRRGNYTDFDPTKMVAGEFAVVQNGDPNGTDGEAVYIATKAGKAKRLATADEMRNLIYSELEDIIEETEQALADDIQRAEDAAASVEDKAAQITKNKNDISDLNNKSNRIENEAIQIAGVVEELECGLTDEVKTALLNCFTKVAWIDAQGQTYYDALEDALNNERTLSSISAVFNQGSAVIYDTDELYALKQYLTVTATYSDGTTREVSNYTLDGTLTAGTSTITVGYNKKTTTFNVTVTHQTKTLESITATFDSSASITTDNVLDDLRPYLTVRALYNDGTTETVSNYTLSGNLNAGTNTITVTYSGKTATFTVNVTEAEVVLQSITAVFSQGSAVIYTDSSLNDLKPYLTVTARYSNGTTQTVTNYTLSGTLTAGTSTITASYGGKTATFNVAVSERSATLQSITATFTQGSAVIYTDSSLNDLKPYLTVTARYSDSTTQTVTNYTLSGTLTKGTSTITASYGGKTATFNVTVSERSATLQSITATFNQGSAVIYTDSSLDDLKPYLVVTARYSDSTTQTVTGYTLSGTLTEGTSTITASYGGKTATFNVNVTASPSDKKLSYITANFAPETNKIYESKGLDQLKPYLTVVAYYSDGSSATVTNYTLYGDLIGGQSVTIGVRYTYGQFSKDASFTVTAETIMYDWDFTKSSVDTCANKQVDVIYNETPITRDSNGFNFTAYGQVVTLINGDDDINHLNMTIEIDVASFDFKGDSTKHVRFFMDQRGDATNSVGTGPLIFRSGYGWTSYGYTDAEHTESGYRKWSDTGWGSLYDVNQINALNGKTVKIYYGADGHTRKLYLDGTLVGTMTDVYFYQPTLRLRLGGGMSIVQSSGDQCYDMTISGVRIYRGEV